MPKNEIHHRCFLIDLSTLSKYLLKAQAEKEELLKINLYHVCQNFLLLIFKRCSLYVLLTNDGPFSKTKIHRLIKNNCFRLWSVQKKRKHWIYSVKMHFGKYNPWYMKVIWTVRLLWWQNKLMYEITLIVSVHIFLHF